MPASVKSSTKPFASGDDARALARETLARALGFRDCPATALEALLAIGHARSVPRGTFLVRRGDKVQHAWLVLAGVVESSVQHADGHRHLVGLALPGDFVSLMGMIDRQPESHDISAREDALVLAVDVQAFRDLREREPSLVRACERQITHRYRLAMARLAADPGTALDGRVAGMLTMLAQLYGRGSGERIGFDVKLSQSDLADWLGLSRQRVNFALKQLEDEGLIDLHYATLTIVDLRRLTARAQL